MNTVRVVKGKRFIASVGACLALAALAGCGDSNKATISGKVTYKGSPVTGGTLTLTPASGGSPLPVNIGLNGTFNVSDVPVGQMTVTINTDNIPTTSAYEKPSGAPKDVQVSNPNIDTSKMPKKVDIPAKYKDTKTSGLTWDIKGGKNTKDFDLTD